MVIPTKIRIFASNFINLLRRVQYCVKSTYYLKGINASPNTIFDKSVLIKCS